MRTPTPIPEQLQHRPFRRAEAERLGLSRRVLQGRRFARITHDVYCVASLARSPLVVAQAVQLVNPNAVVSHDSAGLAWNLPVKARTAGVTIPKGTRRVGRKVADVHETRHPISIMRNRWKVTPPGTTFVDLAASQRLVDLVAVGDTLVRRELATPAALLAAADASRAPWGPAARRAAPYVRSDVDSPPETTTRLLLVFAGLPEPGTGYVLVDSSGRVVAWPDLDFRDYRIAVEYDGRHHSDSIEQGESDVRRRMAYRRLGWIVIEVTAGRLARDPEGVVLEVLVALRERGHPGLPGRPDPAWRSVL